jgi:hypothetical protein
MIGLVRMERALELRFRGHTLGPEPDVEAFRRPVASKPDPFAVLRGLQPLARGEPVVVFFQHAGWGIPRPHHDAVFDLDSWRVQPTAFGYLASVSRRRSGPSRVAWVIAACLPLAIPMNASAAANAPTIQRPKKGKPKKAEPEAEVEAEAEESAPEESGDDDELQEAPEPTDVELAPPPEPPEDTPPPPPPQSVIDQQTLDAAWEGVDGFDVDLELKGGRTMRGIVGAVQRDTFTLIQHETGHVLVLPKSGVISLRVHRPAPLPAKRGGGMIAGGSVLTSIGAPVFISGVVMLGICPSCTYIHLPLLFIGGAALAGGIPMLVTGARRRSAYLEAVEERELSPIVMTTRHGWTGGIRFRF